MSLCRNYWWEDVLDLRCMTSYCLYVLGQLPCKRWRPDMLDVIDSSKNLSAISCQLFIPRHLQINPLIIFSCIFFFGIEAKLYGLQLPISFFSPLVKLCMIFALSLLGLLLFFESKPAYGNQVNHSILALSCCCGMTDIWFSTSLILAFESIQKKQLPLFS